MDKRDLEIHLKDDKNFLLFGVFKDAEGSFKFFIIQIPSSLNNLRLKQVIFKKNGFA